MNRKTIIGISLTVLVIIAMWVTCWLLLEGLPETERGTFGDMFGAVNALFSGLALAGVVVAIVLQSQELSLQREELVLTRTELRKSAAAQAGAEEALREQLKIAKDTARLSALSSLVGHFTGIATKMSGHTTGVAAQGKLEKYVELLEVYFKDGEITVEKLTSAAKGIGSISTQRVEPLFLGTVDPDSNLALVALRIEIEKRLRLLAEKHSLAPTRPLPLLLNDLTQARVLTPDMAGSLRELISFGNQAAHGTPVKDGAREWAYKYSTPILEELDKLLSSGIAVP